MSAEMGAAAGWHAGSMGGAMLGDANEVGGRVAASRRAAASWDSWIPPQDGGVVAWHGWTGVQRARARHTAAGIFDAPFGVKSLARAALPRAITKY